MAPTYRREIDGLRAIAVLPVLVYHLKIEIGGVVLLQGGFLGVDIFFVISGFLITQIIHRELLDTGAFSLRAFYMRRARRLLPPLLLVMLAACAGAWAILLPSELRTFAWSLPAALGFYSNFFWFFELGNYGAAPGLLHPFLHTWSLSIEEQFYLVFPLLMMALVPRLAPRGLIRVLLLLAGASFVVALGTGQVAPEFSFFSPLSRAWELLAGGLLAVAAQRPGGLPALSPRLTRLAPKLALAVIAASMLLIDLGAWKSLHPGLLTVPTVLATVALLACARPGEAVTALLSSAPMVWVGRISYALYLWHFPIFALGRLALIDAPGPLDMVLWVGLSFAAAALSYHLVERPFRFALSWRAFTLALGGAAAAIALFVAAAVTGALTPQSVPRLAAIYGPVAYDNCVLRAESWDRLDALARAAGLDGQADANAPSPHERGASWFRDPESLKVLVIGNSHSKDVFNALHQNPDLFPGIEVARYAFHLFWREPLLDALFAAPNFREADTVVIAHRFNLGQPPERIAVLAQRIAGQGKRVVILGSTAEIEDRGRLPLTDHMIRAQGLDAALANAGQAAYAAERTYLRGYNATLRRIAQEGGYGYLSRRDLVCDDAAASCAMFTPDGAKLLYDYGHWTVDGARHLGALAAAAGWAQVLRGAPGG